MEEAVATRGSERGLLNGGSAAQRLIWTLMGVFCCDGAGIKRVYGVGEGVLSAYCSLQDSPMQ